MGFEVRGGVAVSWWGLALAELLLLLLVRPPGAVLPPLLCSVSFYCCVDGFLTSLPTPPPRRSHYATVVSLTPPGVSF